MKQYQLVEIGKTKLEAAGISEAGIDAELLWLFLSKQDKMNFILNRQEDAASEMADAYLDLIGKRASRMPLQYITGTQNFMGFDYFTAPGVLIPRFDTETLVEQADKRIEKMMQNAENRNIRVLDMCCGSGCIGLSIALMNPDVSVDLCDISEADICSILRAIHLWADEIRLPFLLMPVELNMEKALRGISILLQMAESLRYRTA